MQNNIDLRQALIQMPSEQLKAMLQAETRKQEPDDDLVLMLLHILEKRESEKPLVLTDRERTVWRQYQIKAIRRGKPLQPVFRTAAVMAASLVLIFVLLMTAFPQEARAGGIFDVISWCNDMALRLFAPGKEHIPVEYVFHTEHPGLQKLHDTLVEYGYDGPAIPMWIPEEYNEVSRFEIDEASKYMTITMGFIDENQECVISISVFDDVVPRGYYKNNPDAEELEIYGTTHHLLQNRNNWTATWTEDRIAGCIALDCQEDVLHEILKTIYVMEAN